METNNVWTTTRTNNNAWLYRTRWGDVHMGAEHEDETGAEQDALGTCQC